MTPQTYHEKSAARSIIGPVKIAAVDPFYLRMPRITDAADGTQDSFLVRVRAEDGREGWGESDASPLVSLAAYCCPMSHGNIINIRESMIGERVDGPDDIRRLHAKVLRNALDIQQVHHAYSAADIALWDLVGRARQEPVWRLLDGPGAVPRPKRPYASVLFGDTPEATRRLAADLRRREFTAAKFGWGPLGKFGRDNDIALVRAAREGLGPDATLLVDAGVVWGNDDAVAYERAVDFAPMKPGWLEEPLSPDAVDAYARLRSRRPPVPIAAGEGCGRWRDAEDLVLNGGLDFVQIDAGRIGGITISHRVRRLAEARGIVYVNHTFKSHVSLAASLHVFATVERFELLEYPAAGSALSRELVADPLERGPDGLVRVPDRPGLGVTVSAAALKQYGQRVRIDVGGRAVFDQEP
jgi:L-alanine-DL-glutamate epimerase-like enolase superfamily enzyme